MKLRDIVTNGEKRYGSGTFERASQRARDYPRLPTGIFSFDYAIGGGIPLTVTSSFWGPPSTGKTFIAQKLLATASVFCFRCHNYVWDCSCDKPLQMKSLFEDVEGSFDWGWAELAGVPEDQFIVTGLLGEEYVDILHATIRAEDTGLILLDSIPDLVPAAEMEGSASDTFVGTQARLVSYMIRKAKTLLIKEKKKGHEVAVVFLNQVRSKIGVQGFGMPSEETPGGWASKHDFHLSARTGRRSVQSKDSEGLPMYSRISLSLASALNKRKLLVFAGAAEFDVALSPEAQYARGTVMDHKITLKYAEDYNILRGSGPYTLVLPKERTVTFDKKADVLAHFEENIQDYLSTQKVIFDTVRRGIVNGDKSS